MKVSAINFSSVNIHNNIRNKNCENEQQNQYFDNSMSKLRSVPLAVIIAMSPLNTVANNSSIQKQILPVEQKTEHSESVFVVGKKEITTENEEEFCRFIAYNTDKNLKNAELVGFNYNCYTEDGNIGIMTGIFQAICPEKTYDNKFIVTYEEIIDSKNTGEVKICFIPAEFGNYLLKFAGSKFNNGAIDTVSKSELKDIFGEDMVENIKDISNLISTVKYPQY